MPPPELLLRQTEPRVPSIYSADCICGLHFETGLREWICPTCHRQIVIEWCSNSGDLIEAGNKSAEHTLEVDT
jgi:hypothetical protein